jgi:hypothetical protein
VHHAQLDTPVTSERLEEPNVKVTIVIRTNSMPHMDCGNSKLKVFQLRKGVEKGRGVRSTRNRYKQGRPFFDPCSTEALKNPVRQITLCAC